MFPIAVSSVLLVFIPYVIWEFVTLYRQIGICLDAINELKSAERTSKKAADRKWEWLRAELQGYRLIATAVHDTKYVMAMDHALDLVAKLNPDPPATGVKTNAQSD